MIAGWILLLVWYLLGVVIIRWTRPFWSLGDVFMAAPFWPVILWIRKG